MNKILFALLISAIFCSKNIAQVMLTSSNLPIIVINTNGQTIKDEPKITATMGVIDNGTGNRNNITDPFNNYNGKIGIEIRGHSSQLFPKKQYGIELRDDTGNDVKAALLGMPEDSDWILNANYSDKSLLRNVIAYKLGNDLGRYATRTKFCEVVLNNQYIGIYILQEKIKRGKNRVNIKKIETTDITGDALTGGYIIHIDRIDAGDKYFVSDYPSVYPKVPRQPSPINYIISYPNEEDLQPAQLAYIKNYVGQFETVLTKTTYNDPFDGYYDYIDIDAWVDYILAAEFTKATDAYRLSAYLYKNRDSENGKLVYGPMWDYDLAFGLADYGDGWPSSNWIAPVDPSEGSINRPFWIKKIFNDPVIFNKIAKRWHTIKQTVFNPQTIMKFIDESVLYLTEAGNRNFQKWPELFNPAVYIWPNKNRFTNYNDELLYLKIWLNQRYTWMDANLPADYSDIEWKQPGKRWLLYQTGKTIKLPLNLFYGSYRNLSTLSFVSKDPSIAFSISSDSLSITSSKLGEVIFKALAKKGTNVVSISPEYRINLATGIDEQSNLPAEFSLSQNYPNPFNPSTTINYQLSTPGFVSLKVYDVLGREVATLVDEYKQPGVYNSQFSIRNYQLHSGVYFYALRANGFIQTKKMLLVK
ncbi:MAG: spore coat protein CotH [Stygiobacter sp.]|nr:MAG: spore coat protein CotH [Stygiobacter sp.]KAF0218226.1 MAG: spore coat protein [Ignavibacteria bacterium]